MRKNGFYWVKYLGNWIIAEWSYRHWYITRTDHQFKDSDFDLIIEHPLTMPEK